jgi:hypothetical protein
VASKNLEVGLERGGGCQQCFRYLSNSFESVCSIPIGPGILLGRSVQIIPLPHHRGTPARRAIYPGMHIPRLAREAGLAWGCGERAHQESSSFIRICQVPGEPPAPPTGYSFGPRPPDHLLAVGLGSRRLTLHLPFPLQFWRGRRLALPPTR